MASGSWFPKAFLLLFVVLLLGVGRASDGSPAAPPSDFFVAIDRLEGLVNGNRFGPARALIDTLLADPAPHPDLHRVIATYFLRAGRPAQAAWDSLAALRPNDRGITVGRAMSAVYAGARARDEATRWFTAATAAYERDPGVLRFIDLWRGMALAGSGNRTPPAPTCARWLRAIGCTPPARASNLPPSPPPARATRRRAPDGVTSSTNN